MRVLDNPVYTGKIAYGKSATEKVKGSRDEYKRVKTDDYLLADGLHDAIIDEETWEDARQKRKRTGQRWVKTHSLICL
jgi:site-specific DNA recombinase